MSVLVGMPQILCLCVSASFLCTDVYLYLHVGKYCVCLCVCVRACVCVRVCVGAEVVLSFEVSDGVQHCICRLHANVEAELENVGEEGKRPESAHTYTHKHTHTIRSKSQPAISHFSC